MQSALQHVKLGHFSTSIHVNQGMRVTLMACPSAFRKHLLLGVGLLPGLSKASWASANRTEAGVRWVRPCRLAAGSGV